MINPKVIEKFLSRKLLEFDWIKTCTPEELDAELSKLRPRPRFGIKLWNHQKAAFLLLNELKRFMLLIDMGGGKTNVILMLLKYRKQCGDRVKAIVFVPFITSVSTWIDETAKHALELKCMPLLGSTAENKLKLSEDGDLFVICYQSAVAMMSHKVPKKKGKDEWQNGWQIFPDEVRKCFKSFNFMILDECHRTKSSSSLTFRLCRTISEQCQWVVGLTGTPFGKNLEDLWPQFYLIDFGKTLGYTLEFYKQVFFRRVKGWFTKFEYKFKKNLFPTLKKMVKNRSIRYEISELQDMPPKQYVIKTLPTPDTSKGYCEDALKKLREALKHSNYQEIKSNYLKLRQLSSGFMTLKGEDNERLQMGFDENPKLDTLQELIEAIPLDCKAVVFHHFVYSNHLISERLTSMKVKHARIWSGQKKPIEELKKFQEDPSCRVLVINSKSGSSSLNLQNANYVLFWEQPDSAIDRQQAERRCWRPGQNQRVMVYDLLVHNTVDVQLHQSNKDGADLLKSLLDGKVTI